MLQYPYSCYLVEGTPMMGEDSSLSATYDGQCTIGNTNKMSDGGTEANKSIPNQSPIFTTSEMEETVTGTMGKKGTLKRTQVFKFAIVALAVSLPCLTSNFSVGVRVDLPKGLSELRSLER